MTEIANINNIMDISISGNKFSNWIINFKNKFKQPNGNYDYMAYLSSMKNPASFCMIVGRIGEEEGNLFLNKLLTPAINDITVIEKKTQSGGGGGFLIFIALAVLFIGNINISKNILEEELTIFNIIADIAKNIFKSTFSYENELELEILKQNIIIYGFGAIIGCFLLNLYLKNVKNIPVAEWLIYSKIKPQIDALVSTGDVIKINTETGIKYFTSQDKINDLLDVYNYTLEFDAVEYRKLMKGYINGKSWNEKDIYYPIFAVKSEYPKAPFSQHYPPRLKNKEEQNWWREGKYLPIGYTPSKEEIEENEKLADPLYLPLYLHMVNHPK